MSLYHKCPKCGVFGVPGEHKCGQERTSNTQSHTQTVKSLSLFEKLMYILFWRNPFETERKLFGAAVLAVFLGITVSCTSNIVTQNALSQQRREQRLAEKVEKERLADEAKAAAQREARNQAEQVSASDLNQSAMLENSSTQRNDELLREMVEMAIQIDENMMSIGVEGFTAAVRFLNGTSQVDPSLYDILDGMFFLVNDLIMVHMRYQSMWNAGMLGYNEDFKSMQRALDQIRETYVPKLTGYGINLVLFDQETLSKQRSLGRERAERYHGGG